MRPDDVVTMGRLGLQVEALDDGQEISAPPARPRAQGQRHRFEASFEDEPTVVAQLGRAPGLDRIATTPQVPLAGFSGDETEPTLPQVLFPELARKIERELGEPWPVFEQRVEGASPSELAAPPATASADALAEVPASPGDGFLDEDEDEDEFASGRVGAGLLPLHLPPDRVA